MLRLEPRTEYALLALTVCSGAYICALAHSAVSHKRNVNSKTRLLTSKEQAQKDRSNSGATHKADQRQAKRKDIKQTIMPATRGKQTHVQTKNHSETNKLGMESILLSKKEKRTNSKSRQGYLEIARLQERARKVSDVEHFEPSTRDTTDMSIENEVNRTSKLNEIDELRQTTLEQNEQIIFILQQLEAEKRIRIAAEEEAAIMRLELERQRKLGSSQREYYSNRLASTQELLHAREVELSVARASLEKLRSTVQQLDKESDSSDDSSTTAITANHYIQLHKKSESLVELLRKRHMMMNEALDQLSQKDIECSELRNINEAQQYELNNVRVQFEKLNQERKLFEALTLRSPSRTALFSTPTLTPSVDSTPPSSSLFTPPTLHRDLNTSESSLHICSDYSPSSPCTDAFRSATEINDANTFTYDDDLSTSQFFTDHSLSDHTSAPDRYSDEFIRIISSVA